VLTLPPSEPEKFAGVDGVVQPRAEQRFVQFAQRDAGLHDRDVVAHVDAKYVAHLVEADNEAALTGVTPPESPVPEPRGVTGTSWR